MNDENLNPDILDVIRNLNRNRHFDGFDDVEFFRIMGKASIVEAARLLPCSASQLRQDVFVAVINGFKKNGFFVEIGATDGVYLSNSLMLEKELGWRGILAEPARNWHEKLVVQRSAAIDLRCVYEETGESVLFREVEGDAALSTIDIYTENDLHKQTRRIAKKYAVETVSLCDLLLQHGAPHQIDYLSVDTEGSEFNILKHFDFGAYEIGILSCEHNYNQNRNDILHLMHDNGFQRVLNKISLFDDWYIHETRLNDLNKTFPDWESVSDQGDTVAGAPVLEHEKVILQLQETVMNLIVDRDAYKKGYEMLRK